MITACHFQAASLASLCKVWTQLYMMSSDPAAAMGGMDADMMAAIGVQKTFNHI